MQEASLTRHKRASSFQGTASGSSAYPALIPYFFFPQNELASTSVPWLICCLQRTWKILRAKSWEIVRGTIDPYPLITAHGGQICLGGGQLQPYSSGGARRNSDPLRKYVGCMPLRRSNSGESQGSLSTEASGIQHTQTPLRCF